MNTEILPTEYQPKSVDEFKGPARAIAQRLVNSAKMCMPRLVPASHLFVGPSGSGKTALARFCLLQFGCQPWATVECISSDITVEFVRGVASDMRGSNMFGGYRGWLFDEIDQATKDARERMLGVVGETQPNGTVIVATSNMAIEEFDAQEKLKSARGRVTSRFQVHFVDQPGLEDMTQLAGLWLPENEARDLACLAATGPNGKADQPINARAFTKDLTSYMQR